jgi:hypothetical protein
VTSRTRQVSLFLFSQIKFFEVVVVIDYVKQGRKATIVIEAAFHVCEAPTQWSCAIVSWVLKLTALSHSRLFGLDNSRCARVRPSRLTYAGCQ